MIKRLILGLAVCCGLVGITSENVVCMERISSLVSDLSKDPSNSILLKNLTIELVNEEYGEDVVDFVLDEVYKPEISTIYQKKWAQIVSMIWCIARDWCNGYDSLRKVDSYIDGAKKGNFGPYDNVPNDESC